MPVLNLLLGLAGLLIGAEFAVRGSLGVAKRWGWPAWLAGMLLVATGTSLPELFVSGSAAPAHPDLALGNLLGSNAFNVGVVLGAMVLFQGRRPLPLSGISLVTAGPLLAASAAAFHLFGGPRIPAYAGPVLLAAYLGMLLSSLSPRSRAAWAEQEEVLAPEELPAKDLPVAVHVVLTLAGFAAMGFASGWFLDGALGIARHFGWGEGFAGFLITAVGTSAPELITSQRAVRHGHPELVIGNLVGSNAFNLCLAGGAVSLLAGRPLGDPKLSAQLWVNLGCSLILVLPALVLLLGRRPGLTFPRWAGAALLASYGLVAWRVCGPA